MQMQHALQWLVVAGTALSACASEFHPQKPFALAVDLPTPGQLAATPTFVYSAFQSYWSGSTEIGLAQGDREYDVEYYGGLLLLEYGLREHWALDLTIGYVDEATRCFNQEASVEKTSGLADTQFGIRYQVLQENQDSRWTPDLTLRVGGIVRGTYDENFPFAPGYGETGIEPGLLARLSVWRTGGLYASAAYRHMVSYAPDSVLLSAGFFQRWGAFALCAGYRQQQAMSGHTVGPDTTTADPLDVIYSNRTREINYLAEWGGTYRLKNGILLQFSMSSNFDGRNTGEKLTYNGAVTIPFDLQH